MARPSKMDVQNSIKPGERKQFVGDEAKYGQRDISTENNQSTT